MYWWPDREWVTIPLRALKYEVWFPLHEFISSFLSFVRIRFAQLVSNSYIHLISFIALCQEHGITLGVDFFFVLFSVDRSKEPDLRQLNKQPDKITCIKTPSSNKGWNSQWIFVKGTDLKLLPVFGLTLRFCSFEGITFAFPVYFDRIRHSSSSFRPPLAFWTYFPGAASMTTSLMWTASNLVPLLRVTSRSAPFSRATSVLTYDLLGIVRMMCPGLIPWRTLPPSAVPGSTILSSWWVGFIPTNWVCLAW